MHRPQTSVNTPRRSVVLATACLLVVLGGCWLPYVVHVGAGEFGVLFGMRPIEDVLAEGNVDEETQTKLEAILDIRDYAVNTLGLNGGNSYLTYYDSQGQDVLWNVSASPKDKLEPYTWTFPIMGAFEYLGFFDEGLTDKVVAALEAESMDVFVYPPTGYSTLGWFADPVFSQALDTDIIYLADLVIHELTHNTAYKQSDSVFNESLATFVGHTGALAYFTDRYGEDSELLQAAVKRWADAEVYAGFWIDMYHELAAFYARQDLTSEQKIAQREDIFADFKDRFVTEYMPRMFEPDRYAGVLEVEIDNAYVLVHRRYNLDLDLFQEVYDALGQNLPAAINVFRSAAAAPGDAKQYLRDWLAPAE